MTDVLRYDFQIEEALSNQTRFHSITSVPFLLTQQNNESKRAVLELALYIGERYFNEERKGFCEFEDQPDVL